MEFLVSCKACDGQGDDIYDIVSDEWWECSTCEGLGVGWMDNDGTFRAA